MLLREPAQAHANHAKRVGICALHPSLACRFSTVFPQLSTANPLTARSAGAHLVATVQMVSHPHHRPLWVHADTNGVVYSFPSLRAGWLVRVAVPSDIYMWSAVTTALKAANQGIRLPSQSRVDRVRGSK